WSRSSPRDLIRQDDVEPRELVARREMAGGAAVELSAVDDAGRVDRHRPSTDVAKLVDAFSIGAGESDEVRARRLERDSGEGDALAVASDDTPRDAARGRQLSLDGRRHLEAGERTGDRCQQSGVAVLHAEPE